MGSLKFVFQRGNELQEIDVTLARGLEGGYRPLLSAGVLGDEIPYVHSAGRPVGVHGQNGHCVESQEGQVRQVVIRQPLPSQVRMDASKPPEPRLPSPVPGQIGDENSSLITDHHILNISPSVDEDTYLAPDLPGNLRHKPGQFRGDNPLRRDSPPVEAFDAVDLTGL